MQTYTTFCKHLSSLVLDMYWRKYFEKGTKNVITYVLSNTYILMLKVFETRKRHVANLTEVNVLLTVHHIIFVSV
jgi:hypothetical protein